MFKWLIQKLFITLGLIFLVIPISLAQIDSLENSLVAMPEDSLKVEALLKIARDFRSHGNYSRYGEYQKRGCQLAEKIRYNKGIINCYNGSGIDHRNQGEFFEALAEHQKALELSRKINDQYMVSLSLNNMGTVYRRIDNIERALECHLESLEIAREMNNRRGIAVSLNSIGNIYISRNEFTKALKTFEECIQIESSINNQLGVAINLNNIGYIYDAGEDYAKALNYYERSLNVNQKIDNARGLAISYNDIGRMKFKLNEPEEALSYYNQALEINIENDFKQYEVENRLNIGNLYLERDQPEDALEQFEAALAISREIGTISQISESYLGISNAYEKIGDLEKTLVHFRESIVYKDSISLMENENSINKLLSRYESENKELKIKELENLAEIREIQNQRRKTTIVALAIGFFLLLSLLIVVYRNYQNKKEASDRLVDQKSEIERQNINIALKNEELESKNKDLIELNLEKNNVLGIIAHDLRSPMNHIIGLTSIMNYSKDSLNTDQLQSLEMISDTSLRMREMINRILDINSMDNRELNVALEEVNLSSLLHNVIKEFLDPANKKDIQLVPEISNDIYARLDKNYTIQVFENLIANAIKFSPNGKIVTIRLYQIDERITGEVEDQGQGIKENEMHRLFEKFQLLSAKPTAGEKSTGLGLYIVKTFVEAMKGKVHCESEEGKGAKFIVQFNAA